ncbi:MAG: hypothetical protein V2J26_08320 [Pacificimonas sp.]|nr:hypothetical protein [Pacificimonas sp.]
MPRAITAAFFSGLLMVAAPGQTATLSVGSGQTYATIQGAANAANPGDVIELAAGIYTQGAVFQDDNLIIRRAADAPEGSVVISGGTVSGKALFVTNGDNITVDGLRFQDAAVPDRNGAGIRSQGRNLTVLNSVFANNENGILAAGTNDGNTLTIRGSRFEDTRSPVGTNVLTHAVYVGQSIDRVIIEDSHFTRTTNGHHIKSRAESNIIRGNTLDDGAGTTSYLIDIAEGGEFVAEGNTLIQGPNARNGIAIAYGFETFKGGSFVNPHGMVMIADNHFTNNRGGNNWFFVNRTDNVAELHENTMVAAAGTIKPPQGEIVMTTDADMPNPIEDDSGYQEPQSPGSPGSSFGGSEGIPGGGPRFAPGTVPAPPAAMLAFLAFLGLYRLRRRAAR